MEKVVVGIDLKFECVTCFIRLRYQTQPHSCPEGEGDEGFVCDLELYSDDLYGTVEANIDDGFFWCV